LDFTDKSREIKLDFTDKTVLVTGGTRGIGRAIALAFARKGARVAAVFRSDQASADKTLASLEGVGHIAIKTDVSDPAQVEQAIDQVVAEFGRLDIVVNSAGIGDYHPITSSSYEDWQQAWRQTIDANLIGPANICFCAAKHMIDQGGGRIVNITSRGAFRGEPTKAAYGASKAGLNSLSQSLAVALGPHKIFVGAVAQESRSRRRVHLTGSPSRRRSRMRSCFWLARERSFPPARLSM